MVAPARAGAVAIAAAVLAVGSLSLLRPGYSPDEEFTLFAVRGIAASGLPLLPSGLVYDRGLVFSYASWLAGLATGLELPAFRLLALLCSAGSLLVTFMLIRRIASAAAALAATALIAASLPFWAVATTGRFYAPFVLACLGVLAATARCGRGNGNPPLLSLLAVTALAFVARLTHELAFTLAALPVAGLAMNSRRLSGATSHWHGTPARIPWLTVGFALGLGLALAQAVLLAAHYAVPQEDGGGDTMVRRFFLWQVLNLFEPPRGAPAGIVASLLVLTWLVAPARAGRALGLALALLAAVAGAFAFASLTAAATASPISSALADSLIYPLDMFWHLAGHDPTMVLAALALIGLRLCGAGGEWPPGERAAHLAWVAWVLWFGVIESGITTNYVLLPTVCLMAAIGIDLVAIAEHTRAIWPGRRAQLIRAALVAVGLLVVGDQWSGDGTPGERLAKARPTIRLDGIERVTATMQRDDFVACTDELACLLLVGRVDGWLALDDYVRERFIVRRQDEPVGVYAGAPAVVDLRTLLARRRHNGRVLVVDLFKIYPVGDSREWLPRALAAEDLAMRPLLESPQARVVELVADQKVRQGS